MRAEAVVKDVGNVVPEKAQNACFGFAELTYPVSLEKNAEFSKKLHFPLDINGKPC